MFSISREEEEKTRFFWNRASTPILTSCRTVVVVVCAFANSPLSSSLVLYHSAAVEDLLPPFSPVSSLWEPTFLKGGRRGEVERGGAGEKRKGRGGEGGVVAEKKERNLCPTPILRPHLLLLPSPHLHKFSSLWLSPRILDGVFVLLAIPSAGFQPLFPIPSPLSLMCV